MSGSITRNCPTVGAEGIGPCGLTTPDGRISTGVLLHCWRLFRVPVTINVTAPPTGMWPIRCLIFPVPVTDGPQSAPPVAVHVQVHVVPGAGSGRKSSTNAPMRSSGPLFPVVIVSVRSLPVTW